MRQVLAFVVVLSIVNFGILIFQVWPEGSTTSVNRFGSPGTPSSADVLRQQNQQWELDELRRALSQQFNASQIQLERLRDLESESNYFGNR